MRPMMEVLPQKERAGYNDLGGWSNRPTAPQPFGPCIKCLKPIVYDRNNEMSRETSRWQLRIQLCIDR